MSFNHGSIWWSELITGDVEAAVNYYRDVCGWSFEVMPMGEGAYYLAVAHGEPVAGITDIAGMTEFAGSAPFWLTYVAVDDPDAALAQTARAGGEVIRAPVNVPEIGRIGIAKDPSGAAIGLMRPAFPGDRLVEEDEDFEAPESEENFPV